MSRLKVGMASICSSSRITRRPRARCCALKFGWVASRQAINFYVQNVDRLLDISPARLEMIATTVPRHAEPGGAGTEPAPHAGNHTVAAELKACALACADAVVADGQTDSVVAKAGATRGR